MTDKSKFEQDLDRLELTQLHRGYNYCVEDLNKILSDSLFNVKTVEEMKLIAQISLRIDAMRGVRFPDPNQQN